MKECRTCKFSAADPDGPYCAHPGSMKVSAGFGRSWNACRADGTLCGPSGKWHRLAPKSDKLRRGS